MTFFFPRCFVKNFFGHVCVDSLLPRLQPVVVAPFILDISLQSLGPEMLELWRPLQHVHPSTRALSHWHPSTVDYQINCMSGCLDTVLYRYWSNFLFQSSSHRRHALPSGKQLHSKKLIPCTAFCCYPHTPHQYRYRRCTKNHMDLGRKRHQCCIARQQNRRLEVERIKQRREMVLY